LSARSAGGAGPDLQARPRWPGPRRAIPDRLASCSRQSGAYSPTVALGGCLSPWGSAGALVFATCRRRWKKLPGWNGRPDGYGLGLAIAIAIVNAVAQAHNTTLEARAQPEGGMSIRVDFAPSTG
jgi:hypothetical protein